MGKEGRREEGRMEGKNREEEKCVLHCILLLHTAGGMGLKEVCVCVFPKEVHLQQIFVYNRSIFWLVFTVQGQVSTFPDLSMH